MIETITFLIGLVCGAMSVYLYEKKRDWKMSEIIEIMTKIKDTKELQPILENAWAELQKMEKKN